MTNDELASFILPWAKTSHPEKYEETCKVVMKPDSFRKYMLRLVEIRCQEDPDFQGTVPVSVLDETALTIRIKNTEFKGRKAKGPITHRIAELALPREQFALLVSAKEHLDLEYVNA